VTRIVVDPITRIEGHLRIEAEVTGGAVSDAWSSSTMFRGIELILQGRDPRDAWVFAQRICGVCTTVHAIASIRAVEAAIGASPPPNARVLRNLIMAAQCVHDHVIHFYHLHALDWVDLLSGLSADPVAASELMRSISDWPLADPSHFAEVQSRLQGLVERGQLGLFANAYFGHPAYRLPPEANLIALAHYLEALDFQREFIRLHAVLGGKNPHLQTFLVGGMATPVDPIEPAAITPATLEQLRGLIAAAREFVTRVYMPDLFLIASHYTSWASLGAGVGNYLVYGDYPLSDEPEPALYFTPGILRGRDLDTVLPVDAGKITESVTRSWYRYSGGDEVALHPFEGETQPDYTGPTPPYEHLDTDAKYSWLKSPRYDAEPMEVGPLARMLVAYATGHERVRELVDDALGRLGLERAALCSTLGRMLARGIETRILIEKMADWVDELGAHIEAGDLRIHDSSRWEPESWPAEARGAGFYEAPRGALGHWVNIVDGSIARYQCVVPSTWNAGPRGTSGERGPYEAALVGTPIADVERPLEILRTVHSFDPCMACAVHLVDTAGAALAKVTVR
jgi:Ni,Fe-hydrogenase I large subunit